MKRKTTTKKKLIDDPKTESSEIFASEYSNGTYVSIRAEDGTLVGVISDRELQAALRTVLSVPEIQVGIAGGIVRHNIR